MKPPRWTVVYNIASPNSEFVGTGWEFFSNKAEAYKRYEELQTPGYSATVRPFYKAVDFVHLGAVHRM